MSETKKTLFDDNDRDFVAKEPNEWDKLWMGQPSELDNIDPDEEYMKLAQANKEKASK